MKRTIGAVVVLAGLVSTPALATNSRTWVSGHGVDQASCGPITSPCRTLQYAHDQTNAGGEIDVLDGAGYGALTINKAVSIVNDGAGVAGITPASGGYAGITIGATSSDSIILRGLTIESANDGLYGIWVKSVGTLLVSGCTINGFTGTAGRGILIQPTASDYEHFVVSNSTLTQNYIGFELASGSSTFRGILDRVTSVGNASYGIMVDVASGPSSVNISNSVISGNGTGLYLSQTSGTLNVAIDATEINANDYEGIDSEYEAQVFLNRSVITGNTTGILNNTTSFYTYSNNMTNGNFTADFAGNAVKTTFPLK